MKSLLIVALLVASAVAQTQYAIQQKYSDTTCATLYQSQVYPDSCIAVQGAGMKYSCTSAGVVQLATYPNTACTGAPIGTPTNESTTCAGQGSTSGKWVCGPAPTAYAGLMKVYSDSACANLQTSFYFGVNKKVNTCIAEGSSSTKVTCSASALTGTEFALAGCTGTSTANVMTIGVCTSQTQAQGQGWYKAECGQSPASTATVSFALVALLAIVAALF